jgi:hypothetical protein
VHQSHSQLPVFGNHRPWEAFVWQVFEGGMSMRRIAYFAAVLAVGAAVTVTAYAAQPTSVAQGQAEKMCAEHGVQPRSAAWELCLSHVTRANEWGERALARQLARAAGDAGVNCLERGNRPGTYGYRACINREIDANSELLILGDDQSGVNVAQAR